MALAGGAGSSLAREPRALGPHRAPVQSGHARLERTGVIASSSVKLADSWQAGQVHAYVMITIEPKQAAAVTAALKRLSGVRTLQSVSGPYDMIAAVEA